MIRVNVGCGQTPTPGWLNFDNSLSVVIAKSPFLYYLLNVLGVIKPDQKQFVVFARKKNIQWADATKRLPFADSSVEVIYTSHMLEHLDQEQAKAFIREAYRVLQINGIIRIAVPDIKKLIDQYNSSGDVNMLLNKTLLTRKRPRTILEKVKYLIIGERNHQWMYDEISLSKLLISSGFNSPVALLPGKTLISVPGELNLHEYEIESIYVEAKKL